MFDKISMINTATLFFAQGCCNTCQFWFGVWAFVMRILFEACLRFVIYHFFIFKSFKLVSLKTIMPFVKRLFCIEIMLSPAWRLVSGWKGNFRKVLAEWAIRRIYEVQQIALMPDANIRNSITTPALSYLARTSNKNHLGNYLFVLWVVFIFSATPCLFLISFGDLFLPIFLGTQWTEFGWMLQCMGLYGLGQVIRGFWSHITLIGEPLIGTHLFARFSR